MKWTSPFLLFLVLSAHTAFAQNSIIAGKIEDENNKPVAGATIKVSKGGVAFEVRSDEDGLFYTRLLSPDNYHIDIRTDGKTLKTKVHLTAQEKVRKYYYFKVKGDKVIVTIDGNDPFMKARLSKVETDKNNNIDVRNDGVFRLVIDSASGKGRIIYHTAEPAPKIYDNISLHKR